MGGSSVICVLSFLTIFTIGHCSDNSKCKSTRLITLLGAAAVCSLHSPSRFHFAQVFFSLYFAAENKLWEREVKDLWALVKCWPLSIGWRRLCPLLFGLRCKCNLRKFRFRCVYFILCCFILCYFMLFCLIHLFVLQAPVISLKKIKMENKDFQDNLAFYLSQTLREFYGTQEKHNASRKSFVLTKFQRWTT